ncbi:hypothetical protein U9607_004627 [Vibrio alginolyticus]|uniref:hypothetical protein n=1 Tax=Vibrio TaxID=662 RepID=UPI001EFCD8E8|nr:hypothetical protein [Vibrio parahaemolyticus]EGQ8922616.1 hypothetical protein [Vibrio parahaemolyticus]EMB9226961.1 hypothetical protein [Vibrio alginolyticus]MCG9646823.1 hypothetical protein [Vibrio parahaemolyticus]
MQFDLLPHEEQALDFYEEQIKETQEPELKKQLLQYYFDYLSSLHTIEKEYRNTMVKHEQEMESKDLAYRALRADRRRNRPSREPSESDVE